MSIRISCSNDLRSRTFPTLITERARQYRVRRDYLHTCSLAQKRFPATAPKRASEALAAPRNGAYLIFALGHNRKYPRVDLVDGAGL